MNKWITSTSKWQQPRLSNGANHSTVVIRRAGRGQQMGDSLIGTRHCGSFELKTAQIGRATTSNDIRSGAETAPYRSGPTRWAGGTCRAGAGIHNGWADTANERSVAWKTCATDLSIPRRWTNDPVQPCPIYNQLYTLASCIYPATMRRTIAVLYKDPCSEITRFTCCWTQ